MKKIGITGASGHTGANLIRRLLQESYELRVLQYRDHQAFEGLGLDLFRGDLTDRSSLASFCKDLDVIIHLAAQISIGSNSFDNLYKINVEGTKNLVETAKEAGVKRFIHFSSIHALEHKPLDKAMDETRPLSLGSGMPYERTKAMAEEWIIGQQEKNFDVIRMHPTAILGPFDFKPSYVGQFIIRLYNGSLPGLIRGGYNWVDVRDICDATCNAVEKGEGGEGYILSGEWKSVVDFALLFEEATGKKTVRLKIPLWLARIGVPFIRLYAQIKNQHPLYTYKSLQILQQGNRNISSEKARKELGFNPRPLIDSIRDTVNWFRENGVIK
jgi:dihydroflavonol-4-reductase